MGFDITVKFNRTIKYSAASWKLFGGMCDVSRSLTALAPEINHELLQNLTPSKNPEYCKFAFARSLF
jgi:hypothetical protein